VRKYFASALLILTAILVAAFPAVFAYKIGQFTPYDNDKLYIGFGFGTRLVENTPLKTSIPSVIFIPDDKWKLAEELVLGYDFCRFLGLEGDMIFFPSSVYRLTPNRDSINRKIYTFSFIAKFMIPLNRVRIYFGGGASIIYTLAPNFEIFVPPGRLRPPDDSNYIDGKWGRKGFFRPKIMAGFGVYASKRVLVSLVYSRIFGTGKFAAVGKTFSRQDPQVIVRRNYMPNLNALVLMFTIKV